MKHAYFNDIRNPQTKPRERELRTPEHPYQKMSACTLTNESFSGKVPGDAYLDADFKCRACGRLAGQHPAPLTQG
jgi:hypothetical protein